MLLSEARVISVGRNVKEAASINETKNKLTALELRLVFNFPFPV
jgi:hypothetical protein